MSIFSIFFDTFLEHGEDIDISGESNEGAQVTSRYLMFFWALVKRI